MLEYADNDVQRMVLMLSPLVAPEDMWLLMEPDREVSDALRAVRYGQGERAPREPSLTNLERVIDEVKVRIAALRKGGDAGEYRLTFFVSAHGEKHGIYFSDGILDGAASRSLFERVGADSLFVIADACYSGLALKGDETAPPPEFDPLALAKALGSLEVGGVYVQSPAIEDRNWIHGGVLTLSVVSGLMGAADRNTDGRVTFGELEEHVRVFSSAQDFPLRTRVQYPGDASSRSSEVLRLSRLGSQGLYFPPWLPAGLEEFHVLDPSGRVISAFIRRDGGSRYLHLPPGRYKVERFVTPGRAERLEGTFTVSDGFVVAGPEALTTRVAHSTLKGPMDAAREDRLMASRPHLPVIGQSLRIGVSQPSPVAALRGVEHVDSLSQEQPFTELSWQGTWSRLRTSAGGPWGGLEVSGGISAGNWVATDAWETTLYRGRLRLKLGYEWGPTSWKARVGLAGGTSCVGPFPYTEQSVNDLLEPYDRRLIPELGFDASFHWRINASHWLEVGLIPHMVLEGTGDDRKRYESIAASVGLAWE